MTKKESLSSEGYFIGYDASKLQNLKIVCALLNQQKNCVSL